MGIPYANDTYRLCSILTAQAVDYLWECAYINGEMLTGRGALTKMLCIAQVLRQRLERRPLALGTPKLAHHKQVFANSALRSAGGVDISLHSHFTLSRSGMMTSGLFRPIHSKKPLVSPLLIAAKSGLSSPNRSAQKVISTQQAYGSELKREATV